MVLAMRNERNEKKSNKLTSYRIFFAKQFLFVYKMINFFLVNIGVLYSMYKIKKIQNIIW